MPLWGKVALVSGGSRGIGGAIVLALAGAGAKVVINYQQREEAALQVKEEVEACGGEALLYRADVAIFSECEQMVQATLDHFGRIDILVNNAGVRRDSLLAVMKNADWDAVLDTNLKGVFNCCKAVIKPLLKQKSGGRIINIASVAGLCGNSGQTNYAAAKAGVIAFTKSLAKELGRRDITVNAIAPGFIETEMTASLAEPWQETLRSQIALGRFGKPSEVAAAVLFLAGEDSAYITGSVLSIDGGLAI
ncbi:MAG: 3-oxoacyl-[acyl-carrier-protein] reductase [Bacillota bacterium]